MSASPHLTQNRMLQRRLPYVDSGCTLGAAFNIQSSSCHSSRSSHGATRMQLHANKTTTESVASYYPVNISRYIKSVVDAPQTQITMNMNNTFASPTKDLRNRAKPRIRFQLWRERSTRQPAR